MKSLPAMLLAGLLLSGCGQQAQPDGQSQSGVSPSTPDKGQAVAAVEPTAKMGEFLFRRCIACHTIEAGGKHGIGPNLHGVTGRALAAAPGFSYSAAMKAKGGIWDEATLDKFLEQPMMAIPGTRMAFAGVIEPADRKALYLYLLENSR